MIRRAVDLGPGRNRPKSLKVKAEVFGPYDHTAGRSDFKFRTKEMFVVFIY